MGPTDRPHNNPIWTKPVTSRRYRGALASVLLSIFLLVGCSTGNAPEAERGKQEDAKNESVIREMQATHTWEMINSTPESTPDQTP